MSGDDDADTLALLQWRKSTDRAVDLSAVIVLSIVAVLSALSVYQSARWGGLETRAFAQSSAYRTASSIALARSNALEMVDAAMALRYLDALHSNDTQTQTFYLERFRPEARAAIVAWIKLDPLHNRHAPASPFVMSEYRLATDAGARKDAELADAAFAKAAEANLNSDNFLLLIVAFAAVAFMSGISTKFRFPFHIVAVSISVVFLVYGVVRMMALPFLSLS